MRAQSHPMPNIAAVLKSEISRVARKQVRAETSPTKKASSAHRTAIADLRKRVQALEQQLRRLAKAGPRIAAVATNAEQAPGSQRFSAKGLKSMRQRLGLSAEACGLLIGASSQSVYNWEEGKTRPQAKHLAGIASLRSIGKREALARLEALRA
jgi:DNA-binding transcriptional regulator YiaG